MRAYIRLAVFAAALAVPVSSLAQTGPVVGGPQPADRGQSGSQPKPPQTKVVKPPKPKKPPVPRLPLGVRAYGLVDAELMTAADSFTAVTGSSMMLGYGGGADIQNIWRKIFLHAAVAMASKSGERGFLIDGTFVPTGFPVTIATRTTEIGGGWRVWDPKKPNRAINIGGGLLVVGYKETSEFALPAENVDESFHGYYAQFGLEYNIGKRFTWGVEGQYRTIGSALGVGGVSKATGDTDLGGIVIRGVFGIRWGQKAKK